MIHGLLASSWPEIRPLLSRRRLRPRPGRPRHRACLRCYVRVHWLMELGVIAPRYKLSNAPWRAIPVMVAVRCCCTSCAATTATRGRETRPGAFFASGGGGSVGLGGVSVLRGCVGINKWRGSRADRALLDESSRSVSTGRITFCFGLDPRVQRLRLGARAGFSSRRDNPHLRPSPNVLQYEGVSRAIRSGWRPGIATLCCLNSLRGGSSHGG